MITVVKEGNENWRKKGICKECGTIYEFGSGDMTGLSYVQCPVCCHYNYETKPYSNATFVE